MRTTDHSTKSRNPVLLDQVNRELSSASLPNRADMLDYIADMLLELKTLAGRSDCPMLLGLINLAHIEAGERARIAAFMSRHNP